MGQSYCYKKPTRPRFFGFLTLPGPAKTAGGAGLCCRPSRDGGAGAQDIAAIHGGMSAGITKRKHPFSLRYSKKILFRNVRVGNMAPRSHRPALRRAERIQGHHDREHDDKERHHDLPPAVQHDGGREDLGGSDGVQAGEAPNQGQGTFGSPKGKYFSRFCLEKPFFSFSFKQNVLLAVASNNVQLLLSILSASTDSLIRIWRTQCRTTAPAAC